MAAPPRDVSSLRSGTALENVLRSAMHAGGHDSLYLPCPIPIPPINLDRELESKTSLTMPFALHW